MMNTALEPRLQKLIDLGESGTDILHGELKNLMLQAETEYLEIEKEEREDGYSDAMLSMDRTRAEGRMDALVEVYALTYQLAFAIADRSKKWECVMSLGATVVDVLSLIQRKKTITHTVGSALPLMLLIPCVGL
jgi:hypothetical protein